MDPVPHRMACAPGKAFDGIPVGTGAARFGPGDEEPIPIGEPDDDEGYGGGDDDDEDEEDDGDYDDD
jgi:hypothetical protein